MAFRPGLVSPTLAAQQASTFQRITGGRLLLNIVTGGDADEQRRFGDWLDHDRRYDRTAEFITVLRGAWGAEPFDFHGEHYQIAGATTVHRPSPTPEIFFGGASPAAERVAAKHADVYLTWGETPAQVAERIERMRGLAAEAGRTLRFGIRLHVISRDQASDAWEVTERMLAAMSDDVIALAQSQIRHGRVGGAAPHGRPPRRHAPQPGHRPQPVGRLRAGPIGSGHRPGREPRRGGVDGSPSTTNWVSTTSSCPGSPIWKRPTGSPKASSRSCDGTACSEMTGSARAITPPWSSPRPEGGGEGGRSDVAGSCEQW